MPKSSQPKNKGRPKSARKAKPTPRFPLMVDRILEALGVDTQRQAASILGIHEASISDWRRTGFISLESLLKVAEVSNASINWLLTGKGQKYLGDARNWGDPDMAKALAALARESGVNQDEIVKEAIREYLIAHGALPVPARRVNVVLYGDTDLVPIQVRGEISRGGPMRKFPTLVMDRVAAEFRSIERVAHALRVADDSFAPELFAGDLIVYSEYVEPANGSSVVAVLDEEETVIGVFYKTPSDIIIRSTNPEMPETRAAEDRVSVLGVIIGVQRKAATGENLTTRP